MRIRYRSIRVWVHILVWVVYFCIMILPGMYRKPADVQVYYLVHYIILLVSVYVNILVLIPRYFQKEKYRLYFVGLTLVWLAGAAGIYLSGIIKFPDAQQRPLLKQLSPVVAFSMEFMLLSLYKLAKEWYLKSSRVKDMELAKMKAELGLLRSQLDAHFIFNTLNNLYLLVLNKSDKAPGAVLMLSDLLSYTIYESREEKVLLAKELDFLRSYINLQKLRLGNNQPVHLEVQGEESGHIAPLILFNFIENAFKHADGNVYLSGEEYYIYISVTIKQDTVVLKVINGKSNRSSNTPGQQKGIGMYNAIQRLELVYPERYKLDTQAADSLYEVTLTISR